MFALINVLTAGENLQELLYILNLYSMQLSCFWILTNKKLITKSYFKFGAPGDPGSGKLKNNIIVVFICYITLVFIL
jgi:hypothetical protein